VIGVNELMVGDGMTVKLAALVAVPPGVVTLIGPVVAPAGTVDGDGGGIHHGVGGRRHTVELHGGGIWRSLSRSR